jgi:C4-dicarboxylate transporter DctQ subunit
MACPAGAKEVVMNMPSAWRSVDACIRHLEEAVVAVGMASASVVLFINVVLRYFFNSGWEWAEEFARYTIVWIVFIGGSICARKGMHLAVDAVTVRLNRAGQRMARLIVDALCIVFCLFLVRYGYDMADMAKDSEQRTAALAIPIYMVYLALPVGGALMAVRFAQDFFLALKDKQGERVTEAG